MRARNVQVLGRDGTAFAIFPEVSVGLSVTGGISRLLPLLVGPVRAKELLLLGERFGAARAQEWGLINRVVAADALEQEAGALAKRLALGPTLAFGEIKNLLISS